MNIRCGVSLYGMLCLLACPLNGFAQGSPFAGTYTVGIVGSTLVLPLSQHGNHLHGQFVSYVHAGPGKAVRHLGAVVDGDAADANTASLMVGPYSCKGKLKSRDILLVQCDTPNPALQDFALKKATPQELKALIKDAADYAPLPPG